MPETEVPSLEIQVQTLQAALMEINAFFDELPRKVRQAFLLLELALGGDL